MSVVAISHSQPAHAALRPNLREACVVRHRFNQHQADVLALATTLEPEMYAA